MFAPMPEGVQLSPVIPDWVKLAIADAVIVFGRMEQEIIEISWVLNDADLKQRLKLARNPATQNFLDVLATVEKQEEGLQLDELKERFEGLAFQRNLIVHGAWTMVDGRPWVVWHKFAEDTNSIIGEWFDESRFKQFMLKGEHILNMLRLFHDEIEKASGVKTSAVPRSGVQT